MDLYATIGVGLETVVSREMVALGLAPRRVEPGRVRFEGNPEQLFRALLELRCVSRVVREIEFCEIEHEDEVYDVVREIDWPSLFPVDVTFRVTYNVHSSLVRNSLFGTYRIKDAVCDCFVSRCGRRPEVAKSEPQIHIYCYLENRRLSVGLDAAGEPLHKRGYRVAQHPASLREHLAAAMVLQSAWQSETPLHDPFCGSGTLLIEAALIATRTPPSSFRQRFACEAWNDFDPKLFARLRREADARRINPKLQISGADIDPEAVALASRNIESAGLSDAIRVQQRSVADLEPVIGGVVLANPPYGERLSDLATVDSWQAFRAAALRCTGSTVVVLQSNPEFEKVFSLRPFKKNRMNNGALECTLYQYRIR